MSSPHSCHACKVRIPLGGTFYRCTTTIICGFDGFLPVSEAEEDPETFINTTVRELEGQSAAEVMADVYQEINLILCNHCRLKLRDRILSMTAHQGKILAFPGGKGGRK